MHFSAVNEDQELVDREFNQFKLDEILKIIRQELETSNSLKLIITKL
jgi:hypothetical protein